MATSLYVSLVLVLFCLPAFVTSQDDDGVQEIMVPMCKNLIPYNLTKLPNAFGHRTQLRVYRAIEQLWAYMDYHCSNNFRLFVCSTFLPRYDPETGVTTGPCKNMCLRAKRGCSRMMRQTQSRWPRLRGFKCKDLDTTNCMPAVREARPQRGQRGHAQYPYCTQNTLPQCANLSHSHGYLPNMFLQYNVTEISLELLYYNNLLASRCSHDLDFFLCGTYMPFCAREQFQHFIVPCRELCEQVQSDCADEYRARYHGIPWPNKLQCHRFPLSTSERPCAMPGDLQSQLVSVGGGTVNV